MSAAWVAGSVRARALSSRRLGREGARTLAATPSLATAVATLASGPYQHAVTAGDDLAGAQLGVHRTCLWHLRVLAGWVPREGTALLRLLAGWLYEVANVDELLARLGGGQVPEPFRLGALATTWPRLRRARSPEELRALLTASPLGDPGGPTARTIQTGMRLSVLARLAAGAERAEPWAAGAAAMLLAGERFGAGREPPAVPLGRVRGLLGRGALAATTLAELRERLPGKAGWALEGIDDAGELWRAEGRWWSRVESDGLAMLAAPGFGQAPVLGAAAVLAADAWRVQGALELSARGGGPLEVLDDALA